MVHSCVPTMQHFFFPSSYVSLFFFDRTLVVVLWVFRVIRVCSDKVKNCFRNSMKIFKQLHIIIYMQMDVCVGCIEVFHIKSKGIFSFDHGFNIMPDFSTSFTHIFFFFSTLFCGYLVGLNQMPLHIVYFKSLAKSFGYFNLLVENRS